jgi:hypothetical protein
MLTARALIDPFGYRRDQSFRLDRQPPRRYREVHPLPKTQEFES